MTRHCRGGVVHNPPFPALGFRCRAISGGDDEAKERAPESSTQRAAPLDFKPSVVEPQKLQFYWEN
jgi:hypothetical protein